jgi:acylphosphatase
MMVGMNQSGRNYREELHAVARGQVQGVGFRYFVVEYGLTLNLRGYARNLSDGSVEVVAQGEHAALDRLLALLRRGPSSAYVTEVTTTWREPTEHFSGFHVRW